MILKLALEDIIGKNEIKKKGKENIIDELVDQLSLKLVYNKIEELID